MEVTLWRVNRIRAFSKDAEMDRKMFKAERNAAILVILAGDVFRDVSALLVLFPYSVTVSIRVLVSSDKLLVLKEPFSSLSLACGFAT